MAVFPGYNVTIATVNQGAAGSSDLVAASSAANARIFVVAINIGLTAAGTLLFTEGTGPTAIGGALPIAANGGFIMAGSCEYPVLWTPTVNSKLGITTTVGAAKGWITYFIDQNNP